MNKYFKFISTVLSVVLCFSAMAFGQETAGRIKVLLMMRLVPLFRVQP